jgi:hypothetical protein
MDSDLQDPVELIPTMLQYWREGYDVVSTRQVNRGDSFFRLLLTHLFYWLLQKMSSVTSTHVGEFRLFSRKSVDALLLLPEKSVFLRHLVPWVGFKQIVIPFQRQQRLEGKSAYTFLRLFKVAIDGLISCSNIPLVFIPLVGLLITIAVGLSIGMFWMLTGSTQLPAYVPLVLAWLFAVYSMLTMTAMSLYIAAALTESRGRPLYIVSEVVSLHENERERAERILKQDSLR